jgi:2-keto-3-deoxy-L-rhamnonate aldolase RhmA
MGLTGFDFVMLDGEHSANNVRGLEPLIRTAELAGLVPFVRVADSTNETEIRRALEAGANGIFLPEIETAEDVKRAADAAFFPPKGNRGICPAVRAARSNFATFKDYASWNNEEMVLVPMIENPTVLDNLDEICALDEVKMVVFGAGDMGFALNQGSTMLDDGKLQAAYQQVLETAKRHGVAVVGGPVLNATPEACKKALEDGVTVFCLGLDTLGFRSVSKPSMP